MIWIGLMKLLNTINIFRDRGDQRMKTVAFYSYKGGVGRTLALSNIAMRLSDFHKKVCVLDFDLEAPGVHYKFKSMFKNQPFQLQKGIVDYIHEFAVNKKYPIL